jgi:hypothetical protein
VLDIELVPFAETCDRETGFSTEVCSKTFQKRSEVHAGEARRRWAERRIAPPPPRPSWWGRFAGVTLRTIFAPRRATPSHGHAS